MVSAFRPARPFASWDHINYARHKSMRHLRCRCCHLLRDQQKKNDASLWNFNCLHPKVNCFYFHVQRAALQRFKCPYFFYLCLWIYKNIKSPFASSNIACLRKQCALHLVLCRFMVYLLFMCLPLFNLSRF